MGGVAGSSFRSRHRGSQWRVQLAAALRFEAPTSVMHIWERAVSDKTYYSQFGEDRILSRIFTGKRQGVCVEVGANDGVTDSVTYHFEKLGWRCILVEPNPDLCRLIRANRSGLLYECAASDETGFATLHIAEGAARAHGVSTICDDERAQRQIKGYGFTSRPVQVSKRRLDDLLEESNIENEIDFVSIDVEGHEYEVLQGFTLKRWKPKILVIEDNSNRSDPAVRSYLAQHDYVPFKRTGVNDWFASRSDSRLSSWSNRSRYLLGYVKARTLSKLKTFAKLAG